MANEVTVRLTEGYRIEAGNGRHEERAVGHARNGGVLNMHVVQPLGGIEHKGHTLPRPAFVGAAKREGHHARYPGIGPRPRARPRPLAPGRPAISAPMMANGPLSTAASRVTVRFPAGVQPRRFASSQPSQACGSACRGKAGSAVMESRRASSSLGDRWTAAARSSDGSPAKPLCTE